MTQTQTTQFCLQRIKAESVTQLEMMLYVNHTIPRVFNERFCWTLSGLCARELVDSHSAPLGFLLRIPVVVCKWLKKALRREGLQHTVNIFDLRSC